MDTTASCDQFSQAMLESVGETVERGNGPGDDAMSNLFRMKVLQRPSEPKLYLVKASTPPCLQPRSCQKFSD
ncbi:hypothetical protein FRC0182_00078 [Corynebacterium diphtheriae]|nr:hypothetical protein FRC0182_00078 [Corynebacterium diphtheriae]